MFNTPGQRLKKQVSSRKGTWIYKRISHASTERLIVYRDKREEGDEEEEEGEGEGEEL